VITLDFANGSKGWDAEERTVCHETEDGDGEDGLDAARG
jgi:hypothetical protein